MEVTYRIVIADDDVDLIKLHQWMFVQHGFELSVATNGCDALRLAFEVRPHLVLTDYMMPGMNGVEVCRQIRLQPELAGMPVIIYSASDGVALRQAAQLAGATDCWEKPMSPRELLGRVQRILADRSN